MREPGVSLPSLVLLKDKNTHWDHRRMELHVGLRKERGEEGRSRGGRGEAGGWRKGRKKERTCGCVWSEEDQSPPPHLLRMSVINMVTVNDRNGIPERHQAFPSCYSTELQNLLQEVNSLCRFTGTKGTISGFPAVSASWLLQRPLIQGLLEESPGCHTM